MDYAMQLLFPILGGLFLGVWLTQQFGVSSIWTVVLAILGMVAGLAIMYRRVMSTSPPKPPQSTSSLLTPSTKAKHAPSKAPPSNKHAALHPNEPKTLRDLEFLYQDFEEDDQDDYPELKDD